MNSVIQLLQESSLRWRANGGSLSGETLRSVRAVAFKNNKMEKYRHACHVMAGADFDQLRNAAKSQDKASGPIKRFVHSEIPTGWVFSRRVSADLIFPVNAPQARVI